MLDSGDWLTPRLNYIKHFDKPPVTYWLIGASFKLFGLNEFAAHLPLVTIGLAGILATFFLGQNLFGRKIGFFSAIILASSLGYLTLPRILSTDIVFSFFCLLCYLFFVQKNYTLFFIALALGFMTKGPVVFVITLVPICTFLIHQRQSKTFKEMAWGRGLLLFSVIALPWFIYQIFQNQGLLHDWTVQHTLGRIVRSIKQPFYFFIPVLIGLFFPWVFFLVAALKKNLVLKRTGLDSKQTKTLLLFFWFILPFVFFSCIGKKLIPYLLPLLPALAIITARFWEEVMDNAKMLTSRIFKISYYIFFGCLGIFLLAAIGFLLLGYDQKLGLQAIRFNVIILSAILAAGMAFSLAWFKSKKAGWLVTTIILTSLAFFLTVITILPEIETNSSKSVKAMAQKIKQNLKAEDKVVNYRCFLKSLPFYLQRRTIVVERQRSLAYEKAPHWKDYLLKDKEDLYKLLSAKEFKVFCITYIWEFEKIEQEYPRRLYLLDRAGKYVLFTNREE